VPEGKNEIAVGVELARGQIISGMVADDQTSLFRDIDGVVAPVQADDQGHFSFPVTPHQFPDEISDRNSQRAKAPRPCTVCPFRFKVENVASY